MSFDFGAAIQKALSDQKWKDLFEVVNCQSCGGLGIVTNLADRFYQCPGICPHQDEEYESEFDERCSQCQMVYGGKRCEECGGLGWVRHDAADGADAA